MTTIETRWPMICPSDEIRADTAKQRGETRNASRAQVSLRRSLAYLAVDAGLVAAVGGGMLAMLL